MTMAASGEPGSCASFRSRSHSRLQLELLGAENPGPGSYRVERRNNGSGPLGDARGEGARWAFDSRVAKNGKIMWESRTPTPAPGAYDAGGALEIGRSRGDSFGRESSPSFQSRSVRRVSASELRQQTGAKIGPGAYAPNKTRDGREHSMSRRGESIGTSAFRSDDSARDGWLSGAF